MGVPKFFRWMSERYPAISQLIAENRIPEFDALYLDMNGIIHNCTHKDSDSPTTRMTEEMMFINIFNYIEHLFGKIKPKKFFFMAIDGVAPRAKMNQQRARRFRTALDADMARQKAIRQGVKMPPEPPFDSNCITPGTEFMYKLTEQLKYFIHRKVTEDSDWQGVEIVLSGHEVPGEGEHKIMEYIRLAKAQPDYDPNIRHCLYGLDADLIMLGLLSHDPHFCLLREEVTFGRNQGKSKELEHQNFYLMHLSIVREYLEHEFQELKVPGVLDFPFDFERVLDDFILLAFFVGKDFLPNLPNLHINEGALSLMFKIYKTVLPRAGGYLNEHGNINIPRLLLVLEELEKFELDFFEADCADANWMKSKQHSTLEMMGKARAKGRMVISTKQHEIFGQIRKYVEKCMNGDRSQPFALSSDLKAEDRKFVQDLANKLHMTVVSLLNEETGERHLEIQPFPKSLDPDSDGEEEEEAKLAISRVLKHYEKATVDDVTPEQAKANFDQKFKAKFDEWRDEYYKEKLGFSLYDDEKITEFAENYIQGLQWVLFYYYKGVASWPWFYRYHYAPKIAEIRRGINADLKFRLGQPFRPFEQLMGVLPDRSKSIVPKPYWDLMTNPNSPIIDFYPRDFELDKNGKKQDWEAVVKIPFIEEKRLLAAMATVDHMLTPEEKARNSFGISLKFSYDPELEFEYPSSYVGVFPSLPRCKCQVNVFDLPTLEGLEIIVGLCDGVKLGTQALAGFPSLKTIDHTAKLEFHGVNVFQMDSRNESMVITLKDAFKETSKISTATSKIGKKVFVGYPFLQEALVTAVSDELFRYVPADDGMIITVPHSPFEMEQWKKKANQIESQYSKRLGMVIGPVDIVIHVSMLKGLKRTDDGAMVKDYANLPGVETDFAIQTMVEEVQSEDQRFVEQAAVDVREEFPLNMGVFYLGDFNYGSPSVVSGYGEGQKMNINLLQRSKMPEIGHQIVKEWESANQYMPSFAVARKLRILPLVLSKITASFSVMSGEERCNLGLNLKFEAKKLKVLGYSRKRGNGWEFSEKAIKLLQEYMSTFPEFFEALQRNPQGDIYLDSDFYPAEIAKEKIGEIKKWLKGLDSKHLEKVPLEAAQLDGDVVKNIEMEVDKWLASQGRVLIATLKNVPRKALLKPSDSEYRCADQQVDIGDRVVYVQDSGKVPLATYGTVVGLTKNSRATLLDILWDTTFMSGTTLSNRCSPFRGMTVNISSVLNLSNRQLVAASAASAKKQVQNKVPGAPAIRAAPNPPPLRGAYSAATTGNLPTEPPAHLQMPLGNARPGVGHGAGPAQNGTRGSSAPRQNMQQNSRGGYQGNNTNGPQRGGPTNNGPNTSRGGHHGGPMNNGPRGGFNPQMTPSIMRRPQTESSIATNSRPLSTQQHPKPAVEDKSQGPVLPRNYQNVPPPPTINERPNRGGRGGRGGNRGRAPRGGGRGGVNSSINGPQ